MVCKGYKQTEEHKRKVYEHTTALQKGVTRTQKDRDAISAGVLKWREEHPLEAEEVNKKSGIAGAKTVKRQSAEVKAKCRAGSKKYWDSMTSEQRREEVMRRRTPESTRKRTETRKRQWEAKSDDQKRDYMLSRQLPHGAPTTIEKLTAEALISLGYNIDTQVRFGAYSADIVLIDHNIIIECDGDYWHSKPERQDADRRKDEYMASLGYRTIRLSETDIRRDIMILLVEKLG